MTKELRQGKAYEPACGSAAVVCWILIVAGMVVAMVSLGAWVAHLGGGFPFLEVLLSVVGIVGGVARLRGWAPPPKGISGSGGP